MGRKLTRALVALAVLTPLLAGAAWCVWLTGFDIRWNLRRTVASLPPPPAQAILIGSDLYSAGGVDTVAYAHWELYGTDRPIEEILCYYQEELVRRGWRLARDPVATPMRLILLRGTHEVLAISGGEYALATWRGAVSPAEIAGYRAVYSVEVTRTEAPVGTERFRAGDKLCPPWIVLVLGLELALVAAVGIVAPRSHCPVKAVGRSLRRVGWGVEVVRLGGG